MSAWLKRICEVANRSIQINARDGLLNQVVSANSYLKLRGVSESDIVEHGIGFVGSSFSIQECSIDFMPWSQQFFHNCIVFPIYSMTGDVIGIQIRSMDEANHTRAYKQYYAYHRDIHPYFFGLPQALPHVYRSGYLIVVEGIFDYFAVRRVTPNVVAVLTSGVPVACRRFFRRFCKRVVALLDMDGPGREGAENLAAKADGFHVVIPKYSEKDPGKLFEKGKLHEIERIVSQTRLLLP